MPYTITLSDGLTPLITIPDRTILGPLETGAPSNCSLNLVGRGSVAYGMAMATNAVWMLEHFRSNAAPYQPISGQLWYSLGTPYNTLQLYSNANTWVQVATSDAPFSFSGDLIIADGQGDQVTIGANGTITLLRPDYKPWIKFEGRANAANAAVLQLGTDKFNNSALTIASTIGGPAGAIWHAVNLTPFDTTANNVITGSNLFTGHNLFNAVTEFAEIVVDNSVTQASVDITPGRVVLKTLDSNNQPAVKFLANDPASQSTGLLTFAEPSIMMDYYTGSTWNGGLVFNPGGGAVDVNGRRAVYHTGNLAPIVQSAANQGIAGNLYLSGNSTFSAQNGAYGTQGGNGLLLLNGNRVLTVADIGFTPVQQGGGFQQGADKVYIGWAGDGLKATVNSTDEGYFVMTQTPGLALPFLPLAGGTVTGATGVRATLTAYALNVGTATTPSGPWTGVITCGDVASSGNINGLSLTGTSLGVTGGVSAGTVDTNGNITSNHGQLRSARGATAAMFGSGTADPNCATLLGDFSINAYLANLGYQYLPSGLLIQWGFGNGAPAGPNETRTNFPITFNNVFVVTANLTGGGVFATMSIVAFDVGGFYPAIQIATNGLFRQDVNYTWVAIGK